ncbi:MAG: hypothetical protein J5613_02870 [Alphaproteobacteria bacterium]|nr:hypothetical protein [Alphaproteobacteria bacterium]
MNRIAYKMRKRRNRRQALHFVENVILNGGVDIRFESKKAQLVPGCEDCVDSYTIYPKGEQFLMLAPEWFDKQDITDISLVKTECEFFPDYALEFNHKEFEVPERSARWLYDLVQQLKVKQPITEKVM